MAKARRGANVLERLAAEIEALPEADRDQLLKRFRRSKKAPRSPPPAAAAAAA
jgi:hypothetical protein